jgi:addiction module HigA family antidote
MPTKSKSSITTKELASKNRLPPVTPGEILAEEFMKPIPLSANALALYLHVPATRIQAIVNGKRAITADTALRLGRFFGNSAEFWMNLQKNYDLDVATRANLAAIEAQIHVQYKHAFKGFAPGRDRKTGGDPGALKPSVA